MRTFLTGAVLALATTTAAMAESHGGTATTYDFDGDFDDATFAVETAIVGAGLVIDSVSHIGDMLNRTGTDVGSGEMIFDAADSFQFCSAVLSRKVMEIDPMNIAYCPYTIFVIDQGGEVKVGFLNYPDGPMQEVQELLDGIVKEATGM